MGVGALVDIAGTASGAALSYGISSIGGSGSQNNSITNGITSANNILTKAQNNALNYSQNYTNSAINTQAGTNQSSANTLNNSLNNATQEATNSINTGLNASIATNQPTVMAGMNALDLYEDSLGVARPAMGNYQYGQAVQGTNALINSANNGGILSQLALDAQNAGISNPYAGTAGTTAPTLPTQLSQAQLVAQLTPQQQTDYSWYQELGNQGAVHGPKAQALRQEYMNQVQPALAQAEANQSTQYDAALAKQQAYNNYGNVYNQLQQGLSTVNPQMLNTGIAAQQGLFGPVQTI